MKLTALVAGLAASEAALVPPPTLRTPVPPVVARASNLEMVGSKEVFSQIYEKSPASAKTLQSIAPPLAKGAMAGVVAASAAVGFVLTPSRRIAVNAVGGAITGLGG